jgi:HTTM domain
VGNGGRIVAAWRGYWFRERSLVDLAVARIVLAVGLLYLNSGGRFLRTARVAPEHWVAIPLARALGLEQPSLEQIFWLARASRAAVVAVLVGAFTNLSLWIALLLQGLLETYLNCLGKVTHGTIPLLYALLFFAISPCGRRVSVDSIVRRFATRARGGTDARTPSTSRDAGWPFDLLFVELAAFYFQAGYAKLAAAGLHWADGYTLQYYLIEKGRPAGLWLAEHLWLCQTLSAAVLALELGFPIAILARRLRPLFLLGGLLFHLGTIGFMSVSFWPVWALYVLFVPWSRAAAILSHRARRAVTAPGAS